MIELNEYEVEEVSGGVIAAPVIIAGVCCGEDHD